MQNPSRAIALYGTDEAVTPPRILRAGKLSAELEAGNLRYIRWDGQEVLRAISFIVRDKDWGTYSPTISDLKIKEDGEHFRVTLHAVAGDAGQHFEYEAKIEGNAKGHLSFHGKGQTNDGFLTNRTGFVILHPIDGIAGAAVSIEHTDGQVVDSTFPEIVDPVQPMMDLHALTHTTPGGLRVNTLMQGDTFEMEDQRNWTDASYKTYVRPLAKPWPYRIEPGEVIDQTITVTISGTGHGAEDDDAVSLKPGDPIRTVPPLGIGLRPKDAVSALANATALKILKPAYIILHHDQRSGHDASTLTSMLQVADTIGADPWLEAVIESPETTDAVAEVQALGETAKALGDPFKTVLVSPAPDLKCTLPGSVWPPAPDATALYDATRQAFPNARIGGGMFSYFTELNRKRPPTDALDLISFTTSPIVHAGDDRSVMETHEAHAAIIKSVSNIADGAPWAVGPSAIGVRDNPYGKAAKDNPDNIRQAMNWNDPRQRGLLGAAWNLGYFADFASGGAAAIALGGATGPFGVVSAPADFPQPWFDEFGGIYPVFHVLRGLARLKAVKMRSLNLNAAGPITALAAGTDAGIEIWVANKTPSATDITFQTPAKGTILDATTFAKAAVDPTYMDQLQDLSSPYNLDAFAVARVLIGN
ncbi:hypothetical protein [Parasulfitobacter algicola]|uniref:Uncharacterized protein n=1 Tax=Parasulfitobacter algicola TaxID=2614809 RepID=A0ABX2IKZ8_9RHOB|nr:hypothetical protein [Sulfitobacter algicola]NSX53551.1 hypothetical protein [Sulfitobacter algicola]